jgi:glycosyltransferase involved in cell wall biosynthesis
MTRAPRVLVSGVVLGQPAGGVRRHNQELLPRLARLLEEGGGGLAVLEGREKIAFELPGIERIASNAPARPVIARAATESRALRRALSSAKDRGRAFDLVHTAHMPGPRALGAPFTLTVHDLRAIEKGHLPRPRRVIAERVIGDAVLRAARVFTVSETVARDLRNRFGTDCPPVTVIGNGADHFAPCPRDAGRDAPIVCVGHIERRKNLELAIRALATDATLPRLDLHGAAKADEETSLRALAQALGVSARVRFAGPFRDEELPRIYAEAACVCLPSRIEGFGIVALEAHRARVPLCIADAGALPEVAHATTPRFAVDDPAACARGIRAALELGRDELERAASRAGTFTWDAAAQRWFEGLCAVLEADDSA